MRTRTRPEIERTVLELLSKHGVSEAPVPVDRIARQEGIPILETSMKADVSGALIRQNGRSGIAVNNSHHPNRRRFTVAHELAHYVLDHEGTENHIDWQFTIIRRDGTSSDASDLQEIEANFFAASLLMPKDFLRADVDQRITFNGEPRLNESDIHVLAKKYQVSETAMNYRLMNLGLLSML